MSEVYFAPSMQNNVGILDTVTDEFTTVATTGEAAAGSGRGTVHRLHRYTR